jgi:hypothetical protein
VTRYDTTVPFTTPGSWATFDTGALNEDAVGFNGGVFDGRYVYFVPGYNRPDSVSARYDTRGRFDDATAWQLFDVSTVDGGAIGFLGGVFDGRYVYYVGHERHVMARFDTTLPFNARGSWTSYDTFTGAGASGFASGVFDGRYVYFVPNHDGDDGPSTGVVARFDTKGELTTDSSWVTFDVANVDSRATGFVGGVFDGHYVYFVPNNDGAPDGIVARYDTKAAFGAGIAWSTFDVTHVNPNARGFYGGAFDGHHVYFVPSSNGKPDGVLARFDSAGDLGGQSAWTSFDLAAVDAAAMGFGGAVFDGQAIYLVPASGSVVARLEATAPAPLPAAIHGGSFF